MFMNIIRMVSNKCISGKIYSSFLLFFTVSTVLSCSMLDKDCGFALNEFSIDDEQLKSIVDSMTEMHLSIILSDKTKKVMSLNLTRKDSALLFIFSLRSEDELIKKYIFRQNKRIVGFVNSEGVEVILLSDIDELSEFGRQYAMFIHPTGILKKFDYMKYPENLYIGEGQNTWPSFELIYDPTYIIYPYEKNKFSTPLMTTDLDSYLTRGKLGDGSE